MNNTTHGTRNLWDALHGSRQPVLARNPHNQRQFLVELKVWPDWGQPVYFTANVQGTNSRVTGGESDIRRWTDTLEVVAQ